MKQILQYLGLAIVLQLKVAHIDPKVRTAIELNSVLRPAMISTALIKPHPVQADSGALSWF